jgi:deazaflavin-dependent oxidoreductase (nitroreductase family)
MVSFPYAKKADMKEANRNLMRLGWKTHRLIWNLSGGRLWTRVGEMPVLELVTTGHKSGRKRQILITYVEDEGAPAVIGTNAGLDVDPAWVRNLRANPKARARWGGRWRHVTAVELSGEVHQRVWDRAVALSPGYQRHMSSLTRQVPIIRLEEV